MLGAYQIGQHWGLFRALRNDWRLGALLACALVPFGVWGRPGWLHLGWRPPWAGLR